PSPSRIRSRAFQPAGHSRKTSGSSALRGRGRRGCRSSRPTPARPLHTPAGPAPESARRMTSRGLRSCGTLLLRVVVTPLTRCCCGPSILVRGGDNGAYVAVLPVPSTASGLGILLLRVLGTSPLQQGSLGLRGQGSSVYRAWKKALSQSSTLGPCLTRTPASARSGNWLR